MDLSRLRSWGVAHVKPHVPATVWRLLRATGGAPSSRPSMTELAVLHGTDKWGVHRYTDHYERHLGHLRDQPFALFEIGIGGTARAGASLRMWRDYFPHAQVIGLDIDDRLAVRSDRIHPYVGSQVDPDVLDRIFTDFPDVRVVVDDGSHRPEHVRETFRLVFPRLPDGAVYIVEDTQTSYWPAWGGSDDLTAGTTTMGLAKALIDGLNWEEWSPPGYEPSYTDVNVTAVHCYHNLVIVTKGPNREGTGRSSYEAGDPAEHDAVAVAAPAELEAEVEPAPEGPDASAAPVPHARSAVSGLTPWSDALLWTGLGATEPRVNVVLPEFHPGALFAGVKTAVEVGAELGRLSGRRLRLITLNVGHGSPEASLQASTWLTDRFPGTDWQVVNRSELDGAELGRSDLWLATHWLTAHALDVAARAERFPAARVLYLIQDYEPGFVGWSTDSAIAESTYEAGFGRLVNSRPVADLLEARGHGGVDPDVVFSPAFDLEELRVAAERRVRNEVPVVYLYGRPSKPRNMFGLGVATLRLVAERLEALGRPATFVMAGEAGPDVDLGPATLVNHGVLDRPGYFDLLSRVDVGLCLQASPHPGHAAFDVAISGALAVTNELNGARAGFHPRITAVPAHLDTLAGAVTEHVLGCGAGAAGAYLPPGDQLGGTLHAAAEAAWRRHWQALV